MKKGLLLLVVSSMLCRGMEIEMKMKKSRSNRHSLLAEDSLQNCIHETDRIEIMFGDERALRIIDLFDSGEELKQVLDEELRAKIQRELPYLRTFLKIYDNMQENIEYTQGLPASRAIILYLKNKKTVQEIQEKWQVVKEVSVHCTVRSDDVDSASKKAELIKILEHKNNKINPCCNIL